MATVSDWKGQDLELDPKIEKMWTIIGVTPSNN